MKFYDTLGVSKSATKDEIKKSYKRLAIKHHPDKGGGDSELFKTISAAYGVLSDDEQRARYDQIGDEAWSMGGGNEGGGQGGGMNHADMFADMFRGFAGMGMGMGMGGFGGSQSQSQSQRQRQTRNNHLHSVNVTLHEAFHGQHKTMRVNVQKPCLKCVTRCGDCKGAGTVNQVHSNGMFHQVVTVQCEACKGSGNRVRHGTQCADCGGGGKLSTDHVIDLNIPAGVHSGHRETFKGLGEQAQGPEETPGNLIVEICVTPDASFTREGDDLTRKIDITLWDSIMGRDIEVCMFDADITINTKDLGQGIVREGERYVVRNKGMPTGKNGERGSLIITFNLKYPEKRLSSEEHHSVCEALRKLSV